MDKKKKGFGKYLEIVLMPIFSFLDIIEEYDAGFKEFLILTY